MNAGRFVGAAVVVFVVRTLLNFGFYGYALQGQFDAIDAAHPGILREVMPGYIALDLICAFILTYLIVKAGPVFGGGLKGGVVVGLLVAFIGPVVGVFYWHFGVTYLPANLPVIDSVYQLVSHAIQGAVAAAIYKSA